MVVKNSHKLQVSSVSLKNCIHKSPLQIEYHLYFHPKLKLLDIEYSQHAHVF